MIVRLLVSLGNWLRERLLRGGGMFLFFLDAAAEVFKPPYRAMPIVREIHEIGGRSLGVVLFLGLFVAMAITLQTGITLKRFGAELYVGPLVMVAMFRELGPVMTGFMVAARAGSGIAAEIGAMRVSEQIDAMRACGADPVRELVMPKLVAGAICLPLLTAAANIAGVYGGLLMSMTLLDLDPHTYFANMSRSVELSDFVSGLSKTILFGMLIVIVSCYEGFHASYGSTGVSRAANRSVVTTFILILLADVLLVGFFIALGGVYWQ